MPSAVEKMNEIGGRDPQPSLASEPITPPISTRGVVLGVMILGVLLVGFAFWVHAAGERVGSEPAIPSLQLLEPQDGAVIDSSIVVIFQLEADLRLGPAGWSSGRNHLHAMIDGRELMPGPTDIERVAPNRYRWRFPPLPAGEHSLHLFWADMQHRPQTSGASPAVRVQLR